MPLKILPLAAVPFASYCGKPVEFAVTALTRTIQFLLKNMNEGPVWRGGAQRAPFMAGSQGWTQGVPMAVSAA